MAKVFVFRHAQTTDNKDGIFSGRRDPELTSDGVKEAEGIRDELKNHNVTKAYCATNKRTKRTLEIVLEPHSDVETIADPRLRERDYGELTGKVKVDIAKQEPERYPLWHRSYDVAPPGGESLKDVEERIILFIKELLENMRESDIVLICGSGNSIRPIRKYFEDLTNQEMASFEHAPGKVYSYEI